jgi:Fe2+ or Zn2+ uptake regulation protein
MSPALIIQFRQGEKIAAATLYREPGILAVRGVARQLDAMDNMIMFRLESVHHVAHCRIPGRAQRRERTASAGHDEMMLIAVFGSPRT